MPDIFDDMERLHNEMMRRAATQVYLATHPGAFLPERTWEPPMDVYQTGEAVVVVMELAGVELPDVDIVVRGRVMEVSGVRREEGERERRYMQMEIRYGRFGRRIRLPMVVDARRISASMKNGFLRIHMPVSRAVDGETTTVPINVE